MPSGGHGRSGPAPDPNALRRGRAGDQEWTVLPREGRKGRAPKFPLEDPTAQELTLWATLWKKPQAVMWDRLGLQLQVAAYTRTFLESVSRFGSPTLKTAALRMEGELGISIPGMHQHRWKFSDDEVAAKRAQPASPTAAPESPRSRFRGLDAAAG
jgi:hypothetical protein